MAAYYTKNSTRSVNTAAAVLTDQYSHPAALRDIMIYYALAMNKVLSLLDDSLAVFFRVIRANLAKLVAVFLPVNLLVSYVHSQIAARFAFGSDIPVAALKSSESVEQIYGLFIGIIAFLTVVRATWSAVEKPTDRNELFGTDNDAWCRVFGSNLLYVVTCAAAVAFPYIAFLMCKEVHIAGLIAGGAVLCLSVILMIRLSLTTRLSAVFRLGPIEALKASFKITRRYVRTILAITVLGALVTAALTAIPTSLYFGDVLGFIHPFSSESGTARLIVGAVHAVLGTAVDIIGLFPAAALTVFLHERLEGPSDDLTAKPRRSGVLAVIGLAVLVAGVVIGVGKENSVYANRVYRAENMDKPKSDVKAAFDMLLFQFLGGSETLGDAAVEKPILFERFGKGRTVWYELPFCSRCRECGCGDEKCDRHELDTYAYKCVFFQEHSEFEDAFRLPADFARLLPTDVQRPMTDDEKTKVNGLLKKRSANKPTPGAAN